MRQLTMKDANNNNDNNDDDNDNDDDEDDMNHDSTTDRDNIFQKMIEKEKKEREIKEENRTFIAMLCKKRKDTGKMDRSAIRALKQMAIEKGQLKERMNKDERNIGDDEVKRWEASSEYYNELESTLTRHFNTVTMIGDKYDKTDDDKTDRWKGTKLDIILRMTGKERELLQTCIGIQKKRI